MRQKTVIEHDHAKKLTELTLRLRLGELPDVGDLRCHWSDSGSVDVMS